MARTLKRISFVISLIIIPIIIAAGPAKSHPIVFTQPDGRTLIITLKGDEYLHWAVTSDNYTLLINEDGFYVYAIEDDKGDLICSDMPAHDPGNRSKKEENFLRTINKGKKISNEQISGNRNISSFSLKSSEKMQKSAAATGNQKILCILVEFQDVRFSKTSSDFNRIFNEQGYSDDGAKGSVRDYYLEDSYGQLNISADVVGPYRVSQNLDYYGGNTGGNGTDAHLNDMAKEACDLADADVDFSAYDSDGNSRMDYIYFIYAGYNESDGGGANAIWPCHKYMFSSFTYDGVDIWSFACSSELRFYLGDGISRIGVICHEFGHALGAADSYDYNGDVSGLFKGPGMWDVMSEGNNNNGGITPCHHTAFTKVMVFGWAQATILTSESYILMDDAATYSNSFYRINTATENEYFLLENRSKIGFDSYVPGEGLLIYHVHPNLSIGLGSMNIEHPLKMYPICASAPTDPDGTPGSYGNINSSGCPFPGSSGKTYFADISVPSSKSWSGQYTLKPLSDISYNDVTKKLFFYFMRYISDFKAEAVSSSQISLTWHKAYDRDILVAWSKNNSFIDPQPGYDYQANDRLGETARILYKGSAESVDHLGLNSDEEYYYKIWLNNYDGPGWTPGLTATAKTDECWQSRLPLQETFSGTTKPNCWEIVDHLNNTLVWETGTVADGMNTDGEYAYIDSKGYGPGNSQQTDLISPSLILGDYSNIKIDFSHYYSHNANSLAAFYYSIDDGSSWNLINKWTASTSNPESFSRYMPQVAGESKVKFKWAYQGSNSNLWAVDNVTIEGVQFIDSLIPENLSATAISSSAIQINWDKIEDHQILVAWSLTNTFNSPKAGVNYSPGDHLGEEAQILYLGEDDVVFHNELNPNTMYFYKAWTKTDDLAGWSGPSLTQGDRTKMCSNIYTPPFEEKFNFPVLPDCWEIVDNVNQGHDWKIGTFNGGLNTLPGNNYVYINSDEYPSGDYQFSDLITPSLNLSVFSNVRLTFSYYYVYASGAKALLSYSIDDGNTWNLCGYWLSTTANPRYFSELIPAAAGEGKVKFKWSYESSSGNSWSVDNIKIEGIRGNQKSDMPANYTVSAVSTSLINLSWEKSLDRDVLLVWSPDSNFSTPKSGYAYASGDFLGESGIVLVCGNNSSYSHYNLNPGTTYYYKIWTKLDDISGWSEGVVAGATTNECATLFSGDDYQQDFNTQLIPECWIVTDNKGNGQTWKFGVFSGGIEGTFSAYAYVNSETYGSGEGQNTDLITPAFDYTGYSNVWVSFKHYYNHQSLSSVTFNYSIDNGTTWHQVNKWWGSTSNPDVYTSMVPEAAGESEVRFSWKYEGNNSLTWSIDDVVIKGIQPSNSALPEEFTAQTVSTSQIDLKWKDISGQNVLVAWSPNGQFDTPKAGHIYYAGNLLGESAKILYYGDGDSISHTNLNPNTVYYYKIWAMVSDSTGWSTGVVADATTNNCEPFLTYWNPFIQTFISAEKPECWKITDLHNTNQTWKIGSFAKGLGLSSGNYAYINSQDYGNGNTQYTELIAPAIDFSSCFNVQVSFRHYYSEGENSSAVFSYSTDNGSTWINSNEWTASTLNPSIFSKKIPALARQANVLFKWTYEGSNDGSWSVDSIRISALWPFFNFTANQEAWPGNAVKYSFVKGDVVSNSLVWDFGIGAEPRTAHGPGPHKVIYETGGEKTTILVVNDSLIFKKKYYLDFDKAKRLADENTIKNVTLFPVPAEDKLNVKITGYSGNVRIELFSLSGEIVYCDEIKNISSDYTKTITLDPIYYGIFCLKLSKGDSYSITKFMVK